MGYFPNGTAGLDFEERFCSKCAHGELDPTAKETGVPGCPVMDAHVLFSYSECNAKDEKGNPAPSKTILDMLIPREGAYNGRCAMFIPATSLIRRQRSIFEIVGEPTEGG